MSKLALSQVTSLIQGDKGNLRSMMKVGFIEEAMAADG